MLRFPKLHEKIVDVVTNLLRRRLQPTNSMVSVGWWTVLKETYERSVNSSVKWLDSTTLEIQKFFQRRYKVTFGSNSIIKNIYLVKTSQFTPYSK